MRAWVHTALGPSVAVAPLGGMSGSQVTRVSSGAGSAIVKASASPGEARFYDEIAPQLRRSGIAVPLCFRADHEADRHWLVLEYIPASLPRSRLPDDRVLQTLARLHALALPRPPDAWWGPGWPADMTDAALAALGDQTPTLNAALQTMGRRSQHLFAPRCWLSGDPNPTNWGVRADGTAVLFDWERFGRGAPAIDLAITIAGLGDPAAFRDVATRAVRIDPGYGPVDALTRDIALAKCWSAVELLAGVTTGSANVPEVTLAYLRTRLPGWIRAIAVATV